MMLLLAVLLATASLLTAQTRGQAVMEYTAEFFSEGDHNIMGTGLLVCSIMSPLRVVALDVPKVDILHKGKRIADTNGGFAAPRYRLFPDRNTTTTEYTVRLHIEALSQADAGIYTCRAYGHETNILTETRLQFDVNYLPDSLYPTCSILGSRRLGEPIQPGEPVTLLCSSKSGKPTVQLEWQEENGVDFSRVDKSETEQYVQSEVTLDAVYRKNGLVLTCISRSEAFPDYRGNCTFGPLNVAPPIDEVTTGAISTDAQKTTLGGSEVSTSSVTSPLAGKCNPLLVKDSVLIIAVAVLSTALCISIIFNIYCATRSKRIAKTVPVMTAKKQTSDSNYQGLNISAVTQGPYTALNTQEISLKTVPKKYTVVNYTEATNGEEDYAQVNNPQSPRDLEDTVGRHQESPGSSDSAYVNLNIPSRSKLR